jgi:phosphoribosylformylglycinamidine (FGAM) synthase PurS component
MASRLEIRLKKKLPDAEGNNIKKKAIDYLGLAVKDIRVIKILTLDAELKEKQLKDIKSEIFTNPVTEVSSFSPMAENFDWLIWIGFRPGVRDTAGSTAVEAIEDFLKIRFKRDESVYTSKLYEIRGDISEADAVKIVSEILSNDIIQQYTQKMIGIKRKVSA